MNSAPIPAVRFPPPGPHPAQKYPDDMTIIPIEHYMKDPALRQDLAELMSGDMFRSSNARGKLVKKGYPGVFLEKMQNTGWRWKHMRAPNGLQFALVPLDEEVAMDMKFVPDPALNATHSYNFCNNNTAPKPNEERDIFIPLTTLGLSIVSMGSKLILEVKNPDLLKQTLRQAQFIRSINGKRHIWRMKMTGRPIVDPNTIKIAKLTKQIRTLQVVKFAGRISTLTGIVISGLAAYEQNTAKSWTKFGLDMVMVGVAFIPVVGWVISGIYFIADASLNLGGVDWWSSVWDNVIAPSDAMSKERAAMLDALSLSMR